MCLALHALNKSLSTSGIRKTPDGKCLIGYKMLVAKPVKWIDYGVQEVTLESCYRSHIWGNAIFHHSHADANRSKKPYYSLTQTAKILHQSSRESTVLTQPEMDTGDVDNGFHLWTNKSSALKEAKVYTLVVVECHVPIHAFVAKGDYDGDHCFVATKLKIKRIVTKGK